MNKERVLQVIDNLKGSLETMDYGKWGALNVEQRNFMRALCNSWLILDEATNKQTEEIERLNKQIEEYQKALDETISEKIDLENIIEDKKINNLIYYNKKDFDNLDEFVEITTRDIFDKINEIIDKLNEMENK